MALVQNCASDLFFFPRDPSYFDMSDSRQDGGFDNYAFMMGAEMQQDSADLSQSTYESYANQPAYSSIEQPLYAHTPQFVLDGPKDNMQQAPQRYEHSASPSISMSHSLEHASSNLSHTSGASGQSTASSAVGSPYSHAPRSLPVHEQWLDHQGLGIASGMVNEGFTLEQFNITAPEVDQLSFPNDKFPGSFVGESKKVSSSYVSYSPVMSSPLSYSPLASGSVASSFPSALDTSTASRRTTMDTIPEELSGRIGTSMYMQSPVANSPLSMSPAMVQTSNIPSLPSRDRTPFKSPTIPASAMPYGVPSAMSSSAMRRAGSRKRSFTSLETGNPPASASSAKRPTGPSIPSNPAYGSHFQTPFFSQSSGRFVAPLESSCWFSFATTSSPSTLQLAVRFISNYISTLTFADNSSTDPSLIQPAFDATIAHNTPAAAYTNSFNPFQPPPHMYQPPSPAPSDASSHDSYRAGPVRVRSADTSPYMSYPYPHPSVGRMPSMSPRNSIYSHDSPRSSVGPDADGAERGRCTYPDCGRLFKDLKAHLLTHQTERPEKCPILTCEYHQKGFARKYDKNRHTLTHYKGTMVCGFCPHSGKASEKSFNRADVFKRHLTSVHGVEQAPPNSRKKSPGLSSSKKSTSASHEAAGKCSTCSTKFNNAQDLYDHIDACLLSALGREEPSEAVNERILTGIANDRAVRETLERHNLTQVEATLEDDEDEEEDDEDEDDNDGSWTGVAGARSGKGSIKSNKRDSS